MDQEPTPPKTDFKTKFEALRKQVESAIDQLVPAADTRPARLHQAMRYALEVGGKRLRPVLLLAVHEVFNGRLSPEPAAVAIECLHTYSLIHDDLPAMDDGDLRRGRPSCHRQFDEATAILAGDALLTHAFALLGQAYRETSEVGIRLIETLGLASGSEQLIGGQMADMLAESTQASAEELEFIHLNKTAALMGAATHMGALTAEAPEKDLEVARALGQHLGLAFQIIDDILDTTATTEELGKKAGSDQTAEKTTYVSLFGVEKARAAAHAQSRQAIEAVRQLPGDTRFLTSLIDWMEHRIQ